MSGQRLILIREVMLCRGRGAGVYAILVPRSMQILISTTDKIVG
jgi:hypothetical protein